MQHGAQRHRDSLQAMKLATIANLEDHTSEDERTGAVRSVQTADIYLPEEALRQIWTPLHLERLARTYWRFLARVTLGLIRVRYTERERFVVLLLPPLKLLTFRAPEYEMDAQRGVVRWRIARGLLVARRGTPQARLPADRRAPLPAARIRGPPGPRASARRGRGRQLLPRRSPPGSGAGSTGETQSRIHVIVTHGFLRSLARLDLAESRVGRFAHIEDVPDPTPQSEEETLPLT